MSFTQITNNDTQNKGVMGLPDTPNLSTAEMQGKFDELALLVIIPKINNLIHELEGAAASSSLGITVPNELKAESNLQSVINAIYEITKSSAAMKHEHENKEALDSVTNELLSGFENILKILNGITGVSNVVNGSEKELVTGKAVADYVQDLGGGDMTRAVYDSDKNGIVDNSEKLGGQLPEYYQAAADTSLQTVEKTIVGAINELASKEVDVLDTAEEIKANTDKGKSAGALGVQELFDEVNESLDNLGGFTPVIDESTGKITGYTTTIGGADTVFPFSTLQINNNGSYTVPEGCTQILCIVIGCCGVGNQPSSVTPPNGDIVTNVENIVSYGTNDHKSILSYVVGGVFPSCYIWKVETNGKEGNVDFGAKFTSGVYGNGNIVLRLN